jgi:hypothetical protein
LASGITLFSSGGLDPVLNCGPGDEYVAIKPQLPTRGAEPQSLLKHEPHRSVLDAVGVSAFGRGQVGKVGVEDAVAIPAAMLGVGHQEIQRLHGAGIAKVVEDPSADSAARCEAAAARAAPLAGISIALLNARRKVFATRDFGIFGLGHGQWRVGNLHL